MMTDGSSRIVSTPDVLGGEPRVAGRRISVLQIHEQVEKQGLEPGTVAGKYDLDVADVYRALAYYHDHVEEMTAVRRQREQVIETHRDDALTPDDRDAPTAE
jgi:uncharacterized protein (DUF433 family)